MLKEGAMVLMREDRLPPLQWKLGRIVELCAGKDNIIRTVKIRTTNGLKTTTVKNICMLPVCDEGEDENALSSDETIIG